MELSSQVVSKYLMIWNIVDCGLLYTDQNKENTSRCILPSIGSPTGESRALLLEKSDSV